MPWDSEFAEPINLPNKLVVQMTFQPGDPVRLSKLGERRVMRAPSKTGKIVSVGTKSSQNAVRILFDQMKHPVSLHRTYIEPLTMSSAEPEGGGNVRGEERKADKRQEGIQKPTD